jgi:hypothetical protein
MATNKYINLKKALNAYGKYVVQQSKSNLTKLKKGGGPLYNSISYELDSEKGVFLLEFLMEEYGEFQDKGVRGAGGTRKTTSKYNRKNNKGKIWKQKGGKSPYSFKQGRKPSVKHFKDWAKSKGLNAYAVRESVFRQGLTPSLFFSKPFNKGIEKYSDEIFNGFVLDIENKILFGESK